MIWILFMWAGTLDDLQYVNRCVRIEQNTYFGRHEQFIFWEVRDGELRVKAWLPAWRAKVVALNDSWRVAWFDGGRLFIVESDCYQKTETPDHDPEVNDTKELLRVDRSGLYDARGNK